MTEDKKMRFGYDLVDVTPDYNIPWEENWKKHREEYYRVYGEYPPDPSEDYLEEVKKKYSRLLEKKKHQT